jgi:hypothetical protein
MTTAKIEFSFGSLSFSGEGEEKWLANQLDKILEAAPKLSELHAPTETTEPNGSAAAGGSNESAPMTESLATYLKSKGADTVQNRKFLVTANWLRRRGNNALTTAAVTKALADSHQKRLGNAAECLNQNCSKGFCEKKGSGFFITQEGLQEIDRKA